MANYHRPYAGACSGEQQNEEKAWAANIPLRRSCFQIYHLFLTAEETREGVERPGGILSWRALGKHEGEHECFLLPGRPRKLSATMILPEPGKVGSGTWGPSHLLTPCHIWQWGYQRLDSRCLKLLYNLAAFGNKLFLPDSNLKPSGQNTWCVISFGFAGEGGKEEMTY